MTEKQRRFIVHGWAFRDHTKEEIEGIKRFLETGEPTSLPFNYLTLYYQFEEKFSENL